MNPWLRRLGPAAAFQVCFLAAVTLLKPSANALVVSRFRPEALPYLYLGSAALTAAVIALAALWGRRGRKAPLLLALVGAGLCTLIGAGLWLGLSPAALVLYLFVESFTTFLAIVFWSAMSDAFDARESRRAFTALAGFGMLGSIVGGIAAQELARGVGALALVAGGAVALVLAAFAYRFHDPRQERGPPAVLRHGPTPDVWQFLKSHPYPLALAALVGGLALLTPLADFVFRARASRTLGEDELAALFGNLQLWLGLVCAAFQFLLAERLLARLGVVRYLALIPLLLLPFALLVVVSDALWPAWLLKLAESAVALSILPVAVQLLYAPIPDALRDRVRALMDGLVKKGGLALGGVLLIGAGPWLDGPLPAVALLLACLGTGFLWVRLRPAYVAALQSQVGAGPQEVDGPWDSHSQGLLVQALTAPEPERALHALALLEQAGEEVRPYLPLLLSHPSERVVERGVRLSAGAGATEAVEILERLLETGARRPRAEAAWALGRLDPARAQALLPPLVHHADPGVRLGALGALAALGDEAAAQALEAAGHKGEVAPVAERRELARAWGRLGHPRWEAHLARALSDGDASVRQLALRAVGEGRYLALAPRLLPFLTWREERRSARESLALLGDGVVALLEEALNDRRRAPALRYQLPRVLRQLGSQRAFDVLLFSNVRDDAFLHFRIGVALSRLKEEAPHLEADRPRVREALGRRREVYRLLVGPYRDLRAGLGDEALLTRAVGDRLDQAYEICFWLLGLLYEARTLRRIHQHLCEGSSRRRAYALELLENLVEEEDRGWVMEQTLAHHRELPKGAAGRVGEHLGMLCRSEDPVLRACAREVARGAEDEMSDATVRRLFALEGVEIFAQSDVDDVAEVAQVARWHTFRAGEQIYDEGDPGDALYVIVSGVVDAYRKGERVLTLKAREAFGEVSLLDGAPRPTRNVARVETAVLVIDRRDFLDLISDRPELLKGIFRALSRQLREVVDLAATARRATGEFQRSG